MRNRVPGSHRRKWSPQDEPKEIRKHQKLGSTQQPDQDTKIPRVNRILQILCPKLLTDRTTTASSNKENDSLGMDKNITTGLWPLESTDVQSTSPNPTQLQEKVLPPSQRLSIRRGHRTLTRGRNHNPFHWKVPKTNLTPYYVLLSNVHSNWTKLRYLQQGIASCDEGTVSLVTIPSLAKRTFHNSNQSHKPHILESS